MINGDQIRALDALEYLKKMILNGDMSDKEPETSVFFQLREIVDWYDNQKIIGYTDDHGFYHDTRKKVEIRVQLNKSMLMYRTLHQNSIAIIECDNQYKIHT